jgi:hypothetical protein
MAEFWAPTGGAGPRSGMRPHRAPRSIGHHDGARRPTLAMPGTTSLPKTTTLLPPGVAVRAVVLTPGCQLITVAPDERDRP